MQRLFGFIRDHIEDILVEWEKFAQELAVGSIETRLTGDLHGRWDRERLAQMFSNLLGNSVHHGAASVPIGVSWFDAMKAPYRGVMRDRRHLGLGLYIVDKIVRAHRGTIHVDCAHERGTTFTVRLPRCASA